jgi:hypothetical protein
MCMAKVQKVYTREFKMLALLDVETSCILLSSNLERLYKTGASSAGALQEKDITIWLRK